MSARDVGSDGSEHRLDELWRHSLGALLRRMRLARGERLDETARRAGISPQYLSEVERGRKDPSSEMIAAIIGALGSNLAETVSLIADELVGRTTVVVDIRSITAASAPSSPMQPYGAGSVVSLAA